MSQRKKNNRKKNKNEERCQLRNARKKRFDLENLRIRVEGILEDETIDNFVKIFEDAYWELKIENKI